MPIKENEKVKEEINRICTKDDEVGEALEDVLIRFAEFVEVQAMIRFRNEMNETIGSYKPEDITHG
jgi:hypothetical protein